jgi:7tm Odorant receptor
VITIMAYNKDLKEVYVEMEKICEYNSVAGRVSLRYKTVDKSINLCKLINKTYHAVGIISCVVICAYPGVMYFFFNEVVFAFSCYIPFVDPFSSIGYMSTMIFHLICLFFIYNATVGIDAVFFFGVIQCVVQVDIFRLQIEEFNDLLSANSDGNQNSELHGKVKSDLKSIIEAHQSINSAITRLGLIFYWPIAVQIGLSVVSLAISLFMVIMVMVTLVC